MLFCFVASAVLVLYLSYKYLFSSARLSYLSSRYVLITGCDSGFGHLLACKLDKMGVTVFAACLTQQGIDSLREKCSPKLIPFELDVTKEEMFAEVVEFVKSKLPEEAVLWGIVNNAGIQFRCPIEWAPVSDMRRVQEVNVWGMVNTTKAFLPLIKKARGRIVNVTSLAARITAPGIAAYAMSKHAARAFSECLRMEMRYFGVSVHDIAPGGYKSAITDARIQSKYVKQVWHTLDEGIRKDYGRDYIERTCDSISKFLTGYSTKTYEVPDAIEHALFSVHPKQTYVVGLNIKTALLYWLPSWLTDGLAPFPPPCPD